MSSSQLAEFLGVSAGSVSTATRELIRPGLAVRVSVPGQRQDHFRATFGANMPQFIRSRMLNRRWEQLMRRGEALADGKDPVVHGQLEEIREFYEFLEAEYAAVLDRWEQRRRTRPRPLGAAPAHPPSKELAGRGARGFHGALLARGRARDQVEHERAGPSDPGRRRTSWIRLNPRPTVLGPRRSALSRGFRGTVSSPSAFGSDFHPDPRFAGVRPPVPRLT